MKSKTMMLAVALAGVNLAGCATVINGPNLDYEVNTDPEGAGVVFWDGTSCTTPCELERARANHTRVDFALDGYEPTFVLVQSKTGAATFGNVLAGGIVGAVVDSSNGSNRFLSPRPLIVRLAPAGSGEDAVLLDKKGKVISTVTEHNNDVREKVAKTLGFEATNAPAGSTSGTSSVEDAAEEAVEEAVEG